MPTKNQIAQREYGCDFHELSSGEKANVTRLFNEQQTSPAAASGSVRAEVGRPGVNGTQACLLDEGSTVQDLIDQAGYAVDRSKEDVIAHSTGRVTSLSAAVEDGETYVITPRIRSA